MSSLPTPPRFGARVPLPPAPRADAEGAEPSDNDGLRPGDLLEGRYQIEAQIGEGGVGVVYRALQLKLHRRVAVKLLQQATIGHEELRPRFQQEALTLAALSHPNIVSLQDYGMLRERPFLVMELLEGRTLREIMDSDGALDPVRALGYLRQLVLALAYAHALGIVHRDLKPANLLVQAFPAHEHVKVLDFGMVKLLPGSYLDRGEQLTRVGYTFGTPAYMSPEHAIGGEVDGRSDLYSVGVLLFEMLTGQKPFDGEVHDILRHHLTTPVPRVSALRPELAQFVELEQMIDRCMAKERDERFASASDLLHAIDELLMSGLLADVGADPEGEDAPDRPSWSPKMRESLEQAAAALSSYARTSREAWRDKASPQLLRARRELNALAARLAPKLRSLSAAAWARLRPQLSLAAQRISQVAEEAKTRMEARVSGRPMALPENIDATVVDMPTFASEPPAAAANDQTTTAPLARGTQADDRTALTPSERPEVPVAAPAAVNVARARAVGQPGAEAQEHAPHAEAPQQTAEPLVLEPQGEKARSS